MQASLSENSLLTAEALRAQRKEFLINKYSDLRELCVSVVKYCF
jgi:hypothetical protein